MASSSQHKFESNVRCLARCAPLFGILVVHVIALCYGAIANSPTIDEQAHLPAGLAIWKLGRFDICSVNPPFAKAVAAAPVATMRPDLNLQALKSVHKERFQTSVASEFRMANTASSSRYHFIARIACIPFRLLAAVCCFCWALQMGGQAAGYVALVSWCCEPHVLSWGATITAD